MKNPLVLFTGAALATLAALAGLNLTVWRSGLSDGQKPAEAASQVGETVEKPAGAAPEKSADEAGKAPEQPTEMAAIPAPAAPKADNGKPELDTVRVESDGQAIVAGRAEPGAEVSLKLGDQVIGKGLANVDGSWVVVPDQPLPKGPNEITIEQKLGDSAPVPAAQSIAVAVPDKPGQQAMVALTEPGTATKVLQAGGSQEQASLATTPQPEAQQTTAPEPATVPKPVEPATKPAEPAESETTVAKVEVPDAVAPPAETTPSAESAPAETADNVPLGLDAVDYNDQGDIIFSGRAKPGTAARLYVDNRAVGDAIVNSTGTWSFSGKNIIAPGTHNLRVDQIDMTGKVVARIELPFVRENAEAVAALNASPDQPTAESSAQPAAEAPVQPAAEAPVQPAAEAPAQPAAEASAQPAAEASAQPEAESPAQPEAESPAQKSAEMPAPATVEAPAQQTSEPPQTTTTAPAQTAAEPQASPQPEKTVEQQPQVSAPETPKIAEAAPSQTSEVPKAAPATPAPGQPSAAEKAEATTTVAAVEAAKAVTPDKPRLGKVVIQPGNNLWKLSRIIYGRGKNYTVIYQANKDQIRSPRRIYPGQILAIPGALPPEKIDPKRKEPLTSAEGGAAPQ